jgi:hypothetical protein
MTHSAAQIGLQAKGQRGVFELLEIDEDHIKGTAFNMLFLVWCIHTHANAYRRAIRSAAQLAARFEEGIGVCQYLEIEAVAPGAETRKAFVDFLRLPMLRHFCVIHEGTGFKAASVRAVVAGVHALGRPTCEHAVHKSIAQAAAWHAAQQAALGRHEPLELIARTIRSVRALHRERYPR